MLKLKLTIQVHCCLDTRVLYVHGIHDSFRIRIYISRSILNGSCSSLRMRKWPHVFIMATAPSAFSPSGEYYVCSSPDGNLKLYNRLTGGLEQEYTPSAHLAATCSCLSWCPVKLQEVRIKHVKMVTIMPLWTAHNLNAFIVHWSADFHLLMEHACLFSCVWFAYWWFDLLWEWAILGTSQHLLSIIFLDISDAPRKVQLSVRSKKTWICGWDKGHLSMDDLNSCCALMLRLLGSSQNWW